MTTSVDRGDAADVIVVGGGTSGSVLAARLSEDPARSVLLVEEGPDHDAYDEYVTSPRYAQSVSRLSRFAEGIALHVGDAVVPMARGRVLGGTSAVNYLATVRGLPGDYDRWAELGNPGWSWAEVLPAFRRAEHDLDLPDSPLHGDHGPLTVRRWSDATFAPAHSVFQDGLRELGVASIADLNDPAQHPGVGPFPASVRPADGSRLTVSMAYLTAEVRARPNLRIRSRTRVDRVLLRQGRATGVRTEAGQVLAGDEVILAAGAVHSPALLLRSGIGPADELRSLGIEAIHDLPGVGRNLSDHLGPSLTYRIDADSVGSGGPAQTVWSFASGGGREPDTHVFPVLLPDRRTGAADKDTFAVLVFSLRPERTGTVRLRPDAPQRSPRIELPAPGEREIARQQEAFDMLDAWENGRTAKQRSLVRAGDDGSLARPGAAADAARGGLASYAHLTGSCAMGPESDRDAVLDARCRVRAVTGLRVVDASSMPRIPAGNTYLSCVMMAERVVELMAAETAGARRTG